MAAARPKTEGMRRLAVTFLLALAVVPGATAAAATPPQLLAPATDAPFARGSLPTFEVAAAPGETVLIGIAALSKLDGQGRLHPLLNVGEATPTGASGRFVFQLPADSLLAVRPGRYFWQAVVVAADGSQTVGPVRPISIVATPGRRNPIPATVGRRGRGTFLVSTAGIPSDVSPSRFYALTRQSARRWGLRVAGWTRLKPGKLDRRNVIGFSTQVPSDVWGRARTISVGRRAVDRDVQLNGREKWHAGPGFPDLDEGDLETTLIHELGHAAGNHEHVQGCVNSPMVVSGASGEWWRAPDDFFFFDCARKTN